MISLLALRNIAFRPWRSLLLFFGYGVGVGVMVVLLSIGEALLTQARDEKLVGGGAITVLPQGLDVEVMKTGGVGGLYFSIDHSRFIYEQLLSSPRLAGEVTAVAPQIDGRLIYLRAGKGVEHAVRAVGEIPEASANVGAPVALASGSWQNDDGDRKWIAPTLSELRHEIDHFHLPPEGAANRNSWAEWHYFNVLSDDGKRWAFVSLLVAGDVTGEKWGASVTITLREQAAQSRKFVARIPREKVRFSTADANLTLGRSTVTVRPDGNYAVSAEASDESSGDIARVELIVSPSPRAYFPGASLGSGELVSGYAVPALRATANGTICVNSVCDRYDGAQSYHDHNWGIWSGVTWDWGASRAGDYTILYGRVLGPEQRGKAGGRGGGGEMPLFVYLIDSLGFRAVMRPRRITYFDEGRIDVDGKRVNVPARAVFADARGGDTLHVELTIEDAIGTDIRRQSGYQSPFTNAESVTDASRPYFIQMKGKMRIAGRVAGTVIEGTGSGFFETYR